jgi:hypothetical protein
MKGILKRSEHLTKISLFFLSPTHKERVLKISRIRNRTHTREKTGRRNTTQVSVKPDRKR